MWERVGRDCEWESPRAPSVCLLFRDERATPALWRSLATRGLGGCRVWPSQGGEDEEAG